MTELGESDRRRGSEFSRCSESIISPLRAGRPNSGVESIDDDYIVVSIWVMTSIEIAILNCSVSSSSGCLLLRHCRSLYPRLIMISVSSDLD